MDAGRWAIGMFPPIRKDRNREIQILFTVEGRDAAGAVELLSVILRSEESVSMMKEEGNPDGFSLLQYEKSFPVKGSFS
ncbi:hypothetical protein [Dialister invisus]|uniref:hypothetical protein n=1 Tax=Dialister invisus TaxID=218538 RepID=UPI0027B95CC1|nr:hypothetical protein [Dialister invisus]